MRYEITPPFNELFVFKDDANPIFLSYANFDETNRSILVIFLVSRHRVQGK